MGILRDVMVQVLAIISHTFCTAVSLNFSSGILKKNVEKSRKWTDMYIFFISLYFETLILTIWLIDWFYFEWCFFFGRYGTIPVLIQVYDINNQNHVFYQNDLKLVLLQYWIWALFIEVIVPPYYTYTYMYELCYR